MEHPREYRYSSGHCWVHVVGESARVGVCPRLIDHGAVSGVTLPPLGAPLSGGQPVVSVMVDGTVVDMRSPITGSVVLVNERLLGDPSLVSADPFASGWLFEVQLSYEETLESVMDVDSYLRLGT